MWLCGLLPSQTKFALAPPELCTNQWHYFCFKSSQAIEKCLYNSMCSLRHLGQQWSLISIRTCQNGPLQNALVVINWIQIAGVKCTVDTTLTSQSIQISGKAFGGGRPLVTKCCYVSRLFVCKFYWECHWKKKKGSLPRSNLQFSKKFCHKFLSISPICYHIECQLKLSV